MQLDVTVASSWTVVVPIKDLNAAKSRMKASFDRRELAADFARHVLAVVTASPLVGRVIVASSDPLAVKLAEDVGAQIVADPGSGLNPAIVAAAADACPVAVFLADLPILSTDDVTWVLNTATTHDRCFVSDASGIGTTFLATTTSPLEPHFGRRSRAAHARSGAIEIHTDRVGLHRDVDTDVDLWDAQRHM